MLFSRISLYDELSLPKFSADAIVAEEMSLLQNRKLLFQRVLKTDWIRSGTLLKW